MKKVFFITLFALIALVTKGQNYENSLNRINELTKKHDPYVRTFFYDEDTKILKWITKTGDIICDVNINKVDLSYNSAYETVQFNCKDKNEKCIGCTYGGPTTSTAITVKNEDAAKEIIVEIKKIAGVMGGGGGGASGGGASLLTSGFKSGSDLSLMVSTFLQIWIDKPDNMGTYMMKYISPSYIKSNNLDANQYKVNNYYSSGFDIESVDKANSTVIANVWGANKTWNHRLLFKIVEEGGYLYFYPSKYSEYFYITPWSDAPEKTQVSVAAGGRASAGNTSTTSSKNEYTKLVESLLKIWMNKPGDRHSEMRKFISPNYIKSNKIKIEKYKINYYSPEDYTIENSGDLTGLVTVKIWGSSKLWTHRVIFKVVKENGLYYFYPSKINNGYIYPWDYSYERVE